MTCDVAAVLSERGQLDCQWLPQQVLLCQVMTQRVAACLAAAWCELSVIYAVTKAASAADALTSADAARYGVHYAGLL